MSTLIRDLRYAARSLRRSPAFTTIAVLTLALGIGANTAIFSVVDGVLLRPTPFEQIDRLVMVWETDRNSDTMREPASDPDYLDFRAQSTRFEELAAFVGAETTLIPDAGDPIRLAALRVSHEFLPMVGIHPLLGRTFTEQEDRPGGPRVALIGEALWGQLFSREPTVVGRTIRLGGTPHTIVGVLPAGADFGTLQIFGAAAYRRSFADRGGRAEVDVWVPLQASPESSRGYHGSFVMGRLASGVTPMTAQQEMSGIAAHLERAYPKNDGRGVFVESLADVVFGPVRPALLVLLGAVALVLLVTCVNVANLLLARGASRAREVAVRGALGAGMGQLTRQFLVESVLLTLLSAGVGIVVADMGVALLRGMAPANIPRVSFVSIDERVLLTTLAVSTVVALLFGMLPAWQARRVDLLDALKSEAGRAVSAGREHGRFRAALVVVELALAVILMVGAGLLIKSLWQLQQVDPGFRTTDILKAQYQLPEGRYFADSARERGFPEIRRFSEALLSRVGTIPGVEAVALAAQDPLDAGATDTLVVVGREAEALGWPEPSWRQVSAQYFRTLGVPLLQGRLFRVSDDAPEAGSVVLINDAARRRYFAHHDPLNQRIVFGGLEATVVGVVGNERIHGLTDVAPPAVYLSLGRLPSLSQTLLVRFTGNANAFAGTIRDVVGELDPALPVYGVETLQQALSNSLGQQRFIMLVLGVFAALALFLATIGVYGVLSYAVSQRTREIGIRMAVGADRRDVRWLVLGEGLRFTLVGTAFGLVAALGLTQLLASLLYGVSARDPWIFAAVFLVLGSVALFASYLPSRRAARVDPIVALRAE